jgi:hypothetical protein
LIALKTNTGNGIMNTIDSTMACPEVSRLNRLTVATALIETARPVQIPPALRRLAGLRALLDIELIRKML